MKTFVYESEKKEYESLIDISTKEGYAIDCTGDATIGDEIIFSRATFTGSFRRPKFAGYEKIRAKITGSSYGEKKSQHTFTLTLSDGKTTLIKGRNLYSISVFRKKWNDENARLLSLEAKHDAGDAARAKKVARNEACQKLIAEGWAGDVARDMTGATRRAV